MDSDFGKQLLEIVDSENDLSNKILFPGMLTGNIKWQAFYEAEAFVLPSHQENFGIAVAEALACKTPVLISDQINIWREIKSGGAGIIEPDDYNGTFTLLEKWLKLSNSEKQELKRGAAETFNEKFKINSVIKTMVGTIDKSINP
jgi:glycosyltransferase involved in cell wall biosynthesis